MLFFGAEFATGEAADRTAILLFKSRNACLTSDERVGRVLWTGRSQSRPTP